MNMNINNRIAAFGESFLSEGAIRLMDGPVLVFGGCYSNLEATEALFKRAKELGIPSRRMICTGDVVAYCADPQATVDLIRNRGIHTIMGNCEESLGFGADDCGCGFIKGSTCESLSTAWFQYADQRLDAQSRAWMRALPLRTDLAIGSRRLAVVHGSVRRVNEFIFASGESQVILDQIGLSGCDGVIAGHCGIPFTRVDKNHIWHNSGAIGMPANDGTPRTWFSIVEADGDEIRIRHFPLEYDFEKAREKMCRAELPTGYATALKTGIWPSADILPRDERERQGVAISPGTIKWSNDFPKNTLSEDLIGSLKRKKFSDPDITATGERRASVSLTGLKTLWFNTGTLCNLTCKNCYIESSPKNDRLVYLSRSEVADFLQEAKLTHPELEEIGFTGGEPFMNPGILGMIEDALLGGWRVLVLTNAMRPMQHKRDALLKLHQCYPGRLSVRVSIDHYTQERHEEVRGPRSWQPAIDGLKWLSEHGFDFAIASRNLWNEAESSMRWEYQRSFDDLGIDLDTNALSRLVIFPEMNADADVPEITEDCWGLLNKHPDSVMCSSSRMVIKRKEAARPAVLSCTLLPYDEAFELGDTLSSAKSTVKLNHPHCSKFCVLGGASCSLGKS